ncbi:hypothetical protein FHS74_002746 [Nitrospirillum iridis]|uniref:Uncharacterized protein n=1 Tax=Nitrospirillum iridis TaxID=765888 RepID=A0A7X0B0N5_9PROT|nr:hypothetical protein [Nitrospirillum iridis]
MVSSPIPCERAIQFQHGKGWPAPQSFFTRDGGLPSRGPPFPLAYPSVIPPLPFDHSPMLERVPGSHNARRAFSGAAHPSVTAGRGSRAWLPCSRPPWPSWTRRNQGHHQRLMSSAGCRHHGGSNQKSGPSVALSGGGEALPVNPAPNAGSNGLSRRRPSPAWKRFQRRHKIGALIVPASDSFLSAVRITTKAHLIPAALRKRWLKCQGVVPVSM